MIWAPALLLALFLGAPVGVVLLRGIVDGAVLAAVASPEVVEALTLSLVTTAIALVIILVLGTPLAYVLARRRFRGASLVETIVDLPIVLPPSVAGLALLLLLGRRGVLGEVFDVFGVSVPFTTLAVVLAQVFVAAPLYVRSARAGLAAVDRDLEDAARVDGGSERQVVRWVTLPLAGSALTAGLVMCWARALGEFGATILFAGSVAGVTRTLPLLVYSDFQAGDLAAAMAAASVLVLAALAVLLAVRLTRRPGAIGVAGG